jgi:hypothetical protein
LALRSTTRRIPASYPSTGMTLAVS